MATKSQAAREAEEQAERDKAEQEAREAEATAKREAEEKAAREAEEQAQAATDRAASENRLPESMAVTNPAPATEMESPSGAFIEPEIKQALPTDHPAIDNNPRAGTSAVQNGGDFNDPRRVHPSDPGFVGQGLDLSVYGTQTKSED